MDLAAWDGLSSVFAGRKSRRLRGLSQSAGEHQASCSIRFEVDGLPNNRIRRKRSGNAGKPNAGQIAGNVQEICRKYVGGKTYKADEIMRGAKAADNSPIVWLFR